MKRIGIITFNRAINYGALLQSFALKKTVEKYESCVVINYKNLYIENLYNPQGKVKAILKKLFYKKRINRFKNFIAGFSTKEIYEKQNIHLLGFEKIITGSDQVWNMDCSGNDETYLLPDCRKARKYSYAASFGKSQLSNNQIDVFKKKLEQFRYISVREKTGQIICQSQLGVSAEVCLDPTLLLSKQEWKENLNIATNRKKYILLFVFNLTPEIKKLAIQLKKKYKLPIYNLTLSSQCFFGNKVIRNAGPKEWVEMFYNASFIITDSFHGTAFSINFNKQFYSFAKNARASRIIDLLELLQLNHRLNPTIVDLEVEKQIEYSQANLKLNMEREKSISFIEKIVND